MEFNGAEDMQAVLVDLRPAPENMVDNSRRTLAPQNQRPGLRRTSAPALGQELGNTASEPPSYTANAVVGRYTGEPIMRPMLARLMIPQTTLDGRPMALMANQGATQGSSIQIQPTGGNVVRLSLSNKVFIKDRHKVKKRKTVVEKEEPMQPMIWTPQFQRLSDPSLKPLPPTKPPTPPEPVVQDASGETPYVLPRERRGK
ncbi:hypothetical protein HPB47_009805 [Ixodes persulcatus]|uniref:Uncharacterized protein n=1 Tax=Ixodes persulcatus TaxID=34615 RepID=A0AC60P0T4_IXOPE|nr:hypothetical protein HPB47_009805 [Ixodes persulcatus]